LALLAVSKTLTTDKQHKQEHRILSRLGRSAGRRLRRQAMGKLIAALVAAILGFVLVITSIGWLGVFGLKVSLAPRFLVARAAA
jgi:hypothetical protein